MPAGYVEEEPVAEEELTLELVAEAEVEVSPAEAKLAATFRQYNTNGNDVLDTEEVTAMMTEMGYKTMPGKFGTAPQLDYQGAASERCLVSAEYVNGIMDVFATFDDHDDENPVVEYERFAELWAHLGGGDHAGATAAKEGDQDTPYRADFDKYDLNGDGLLSQMEVKQMMVSLGYKAGSDYVSDLLDTFGSYDADDDGVIEPAEFQLLWEHLGMHEKDVAVASLTAEVAAVVPSGHPLQDQFDKFDLNKDGVLDMDEVKAMMGVLGYKTSDDYVAQTMDLFGDYDADGDGMVQIEEFEALWKHLGGDQVSAAQGTVKEVPAEVLADPLYGRFQSFDQTSQGFLTRHDIQGMMTALGYAANEDYLTSLLDLFGIFDADDDGVVDFDEFKDLWAHLGGEDAMGAAEGTSKRTEHSDDPLWATFCKYDKTGSGSMSQREVKEMMVVLGYTADEKYLQVMKK